MEATGSSIRYRASVGRTTKGAYSLDWTVERVFTDEEMEETTLLEREDYMRDAVKSFGAKLEAAYPATAEAAKPEKAN